MSTTPNTRSDTERWLEQLGTGFRDVWMLTKDGWVEECHVDDPETFATTIGMSLDRLRGRFAIWLCPDGHWQLYDHAKRTATCYPSRQAAEMVAILRAR